MRSSLSSRSKQASSGFSSRPPSPDRNTSGNGKPSKPAYRLDESKLVNIPDTLTELDQWVLWRFILRDGRWTKLPFQAQAPEQPADSTDPQTWNPFQFTLEAYRKSLRTKSPADGIGFVFAHDGGLTGFDLDGAILAGGSIDPFAGQILARLSPTYAEISPSGCGIKGIVCGELPGTGMNRKGLGPDRNIGLELYSAGRFFTITGAALDDCREIHDHSEAILDLYRQYKLQPHELNGQAPGGEPTFEDQYLLTKARNAANGAEFRRLYDHGEYEGYSASEADFRLCCRLAFWFNRNPDAIDRMFRGSALMRDKWDDPRADRTYGEITIENAVAITKEVYSPATSASSFANFTMGENEKGEPVREAKPTADLLADLDRIVPGWPKRVNERLFVQREDFHPTYLESSTELFGWIDGQAQVFWAEGMAMVSQGRFFEHLRKFSAERFDSIETFPHYPPMPRTFYMHPHVVPSTGKLLDRFLAFFSPATKIDAELIRAMVLTLFWGGTPGHRPAFRIEGPEEDQECGRGSGKSALSVAVSHLVGGFVNLRETDDMTALTTRLLSSEEGRKRVLRIDNVKTLRLSWAALEEFITSPTISGKQLYYGEGQKPNLMTVIITMNGGSFSKDMALRVIPIRLARPKYDGTWPRRVQTFVEEHRWDLTAEILGELAGESAMITERTRWGEWERGVLSKCSHVAQCQDTIGDRIAAIDDDDNESHEIESHFARRLEERGHEPATEAVKIPTQVVAEWLGEVEKRPVKAAAATTLLQTKPLKRLRYKRTETGRYWVWTGEQASDHLKAEPVALNPLPWEKQP